MTDVDSAGGVSSFDHVTIVVQDIELSAARYESLFGLPPTWRGEHPDLGTQAAIFGVGNAMVELVGPHAGDERDEGLRSLLEARGDGLHAIAFGTDDAASCREALRSRGLKAAPPAEGTAVGVDGTSRSYRSVELNPRDTRGLGVLVVERSDAALLSRLSAARRGAVQALDHVVVRTSAPDAALGLYGNGLGLRLALDRDLAGTRMLFFRVGGVTVEVVEDASLGDADRFYGLAYRVDDIEAAYTRLRHASFELGEIRDGNKPGTRVFTVRGGTCRVPTLVLRDPSRDARDRAGR